MPLSVNLSPDQMNVLGEGQFYLKDWGDGGHAQVAGALEKRGVIEAVPGIRPAATGFVTARAYRVVGEGESKFEVVVCDESFFQRRVNVWSRSSVHAGLDAVKKAASLPELFEGQLGDTEMVWKVLSIEEVKLSD